MFLTSVSRISNLAAVDAIMYAREKQLLNSTHELQNIATNIESQAQDERNFFALMSHELRTPLNSIINMHRFLLDDRNSLKESQLDFVKTSYASAEALLCGMYSLLIVAYQL